MSDRSVKKVIEELYATGLSPEQQALVGELILSASRYSVHHHYGVEQSAAALRQRRYRERNKPSPSVTETPDGVLLDSNQEKKEKENTPPSPRDALKTILDTERTAAVIESRQKLRKPLTYRAAKLLAAEFAKAPDPNAAADLMVARGWTGFEVGWLKDKDRGKTAKIYSMPTFQPEPEIERPDEAERKAQVERLLGKTARGMKA